MNEIKTTKLLAIIGVIFVSAATMAIIAIDVVVVVIWRRLEKEERGRVYPLKQRVFEALAPGTVPGHPAPMGRAASACCCSGIVTATVTTTTPSNPSAATMAIIAIDVFVVVVISLSPVYGWKQRPCEALSAGVLKP